MSVFRGLISFGVLRDIVVLFVTLWAVNWVDVSEWRSAVVNKVINWRLQVLIAVAEHCCGHVVPLSVCLGSERQIAVDLL
jgi:hypothetical protein